jgi:cysteine synthase
MSDHVLRVYDSVLHMLSSVDNPTPIVRLLHVTPYKHTQVYAKLEWYNPFGAVKDRVAANLVRDAEERGEKLENLVEPTSGNTGMGLAMLSNAKGYKFAATMSKEIPLEKRTALRFFGTDLYELEDTLCPMPGQPEGAMAKATELAERPGWKQLNQYKNPANPDAHFRTTGPEIWKQTGGKITHFVASLGTCGTITGTGRFLKAQNPGVKVLGVYPTDGHDIPGVRSRRALRVTDFFQARGIRRRRRDFRRGSLCSLPPSQSRGEPYRWPKWWFGPGWRAPPDPRRAGQHRGRDLSGQRIQVHIVLSKTSAPTLSQPGSSGARNHGVGSIRSALAGGVRARREGA